MPSPPRAFGNGVSTGDTLAAGRGRQRLKLAAVGYAASRHGVDAYEEIVRAGVTLLCKTALEFVDTLPGSLAKGRGLDRPVNSEGLQIAAIAYAAARHGVDADVGMAREGLAILCQAAIDFVETLPKEDAKRVNNPHLQLSNSV